MGSSMKRESMTHRKPTMADGNLLYHGTSLLQFARMRDGGFVVRDLYLGDSRENIADNYAEMQAERDRSYPVTLFIDPRRLEGLEEDFHDRVGEQVRQEGQFFYSGPLCEALVTAVALNDEGEEVHLPFDAEVDLPLPVVAGDLSLPLPKR